MKKNYGFVKIYTLTDLENIPFYVGCTVLELRVRMMNHIYDSRLDKTYSNVLKNNKIRSLNFQIKIKALFIVPVDNCRGYLARRRGEQIETYWIQRMLTEGYELCNSAKERNRTVAV